MRPFAPRPRSMQRSMHGSAFTLVLGPLLASSALGCSFSAGEGPADAEVGNAQAALVTIERSAGEAARADVVVRVVRAHGGPLDEAAIRLAGLGDELPALGTCAVFGGSLGRAGGSGAGGSAFGMRSLELVDLGGVAVEVGDALRAPLVARHVPDPAGVLSGLVYNARIAAESAAQLTPRAVVTVRAAGATGDVDAVAFAATITIPRDVTDVRLAGQDPRELATPIATGAGPSVELTWAAPEPEDLAPGTLDTLGVDVRPLDTTRPGLRCAFPDTGRATIPAFPTASAIDEGTLTLHRIRRERFRVEAGRGHGRESDGEIRFDAARSVPYVRKTRPAL